MSRFDNKASSVSRFQKWFVPLVAAVVPFTACSEPTGTVDDLRIGFSVQASVVRAGEPLIAKLVITNPTRDTIKVSSGSSCVATLDAVRNNERVDLQGTAFACLTVVTTFAIPPRDSLVRNFALVAMLREGQSPWRYVVPPEPGIYQLRAAMQVGLPDEYVAFEVTPSNEEL
jgi:hypothetical protein